ncbi:MAG: SDR family oxidoreductase, partial [bacterium]|nr:SDR family oxidoreductase [bacterium]
MDVRDREQWFAGRVAIVVGATGGIGAAICEELAERGAGLRMIGRDLERLARIAADVQDAAPSVETAVVDLRDRPGLTEAIDGWADASILVNAAGMNSPGPFTDIPEADYDALMEANVSGVFWASRAFVRA